MVQYTVDSRRAVPVLSLGLGIQLWVRQVTKSVVAAVEGNGDNTLQSQAAAIPPSVVAGLVTALIPYQYGKLLVCRGGIGPNIQAQAVLAVCGGAVSGRAWALKGREQKEKK